MANLYDKNIDKHIDWNGDVATENKPVSGRAVQKFIKDTLQSKIGYIYDDRNNNVCIGFADKEDYNLYVSDPNLHENLILQSWYSYHPPIPVTLDYPAYYGTVDNKIVDDVSSLSLTTALSVTCGSYKPYVYVALYKNYRLTRAVTASNEDVKNDFVVIDVELIINGVSYTLYELHADSGLPLDVNITLSFSKT